MKPKNNDFPNHDDTLNDNDTNHDNYDTLSTLGIILIRMFEIVNFEKRPFSYRDFLSFDYQGITYRFKHGTIRNIFSKLVKQDKIEHVYTSTAAFYTLKGVKVGKVITPAHTGGHSSAYPSLNHYQRKYLQWLLNIPMDKPGIHDVLLNFKIKGLWEIIQMYPNNLVRNVDLKNNKDITLHKLDFGNHIIKIAIHRTDNVSVRIACTYSPIPLDVMGLAKLTGSLTRVEERLQGVIDIYLATNLRSNKLSTSLTCKSPIPNCMTWTAKMWHFGQDSLTSYSGDLFDISWGDSIEVFHVYSKIAESKKKIWIRKEIQEYPNKSWLEAFKEKMHLLEENYSNYINQKFNESLGGLTSS